MTKVHTMTLAAMKTHTDIDLSTQTGTVWIRYARCHISWHIVNFISERAFTQVNQENCGKYVHKLHLDRDLYSLCLKTTKCDNDMELGGARSHVEWKAGVSVAGCD